MSEMKRPANMSRIRSFFERWERLETQRRELSDDLKELFSEAKGEGFNSKALRAAFAEKFRVENETSTKAEKRQMDEADADLYLAALAGPSHACEAGSYAEHSMSMYLRKEDMPAHDPETGEITEHEQPETATQSGPSTEVRPESPFSSDAGTLDRFTSAPTESASDEISASIPQSAGSPPAADKPETVVTPLPAVSGAISDEDVPAFLKKDRDPVNERCEKPLTCKFGRHPQKLTCSTCTTAWAIAHRKAVTA